MRGYREVTLPKMTRDKHYFSICLFLSYSKDICTHIHSYELAYSIGKQLTTPRLMLSLNNQTAKKVGVST